MGRVILVELALLAGLAWALVHGTLWLLERSRPAALPAPVRWRVTHHDADGETRVVLQKYGDRGDRVLGQHVVGTVRLDDPDYDAAFLAVMETARQRRALFESEEDR
jgi:hypothetical protein